jgi:hypothetical protein
MVVGGVEVFVVMVVVVFVEGDGRGACSGFVDYILGLFALRFLRSGRSLLFCILSLSFSFRLQ